MREPHVSDTWGKRVPGEGIANVKALREPSERVYRGQRIRRLVYLEMNEKARVGLLGMY